MAASARLGLRAAAFVALVPLCLFSRTVEHSAAALAGPAAAQQLRGWRAEPVAGWRETEFEFLGLCTGEDSCERLQALLADPAIDPTLKSRLASAFQRGRMLVWDVHALGLAYWRWAARLVLP